ncbi:hypothetical protein Syun_030862 [Stephania yunnanensis]|uniref:PGG domain-containing protein n=1 Tax=Stephania yunnanensis TaxID=152371 RepID=A0AAP0HAX8_9MAGN
MKALFQASLQGNVAALKELLRNDPLVLERMIIDSSETPLHIAAMFGHVEFAREILSRKPELASELDSEGLSPLHLASAGKNVEMVRELVRVAPDVCLSTDSEGRTPLHLAAMKSRVEIMKELFKCRPEAVDKVLLNGGETILHLCVKHSRFDALELLLQWRVGQEGPSDLRRVCVNSKDEDGNTILHLAVAKKHIQIIKLLLNSNSSSTTTTHDHVEVNALNKNTFTALDILAQSTVRDIKDMEIAELLRGAGGLRAVEIANTTSTTITDSNANGETNAAHVVRISDNNNSSVPRTQTMEIINGTVRNWGKRLNEYEKWLEKKLNTVMVVASLVAGIGFQAVLNPPNRFNLNPAATSNDKQPRHFRYHSAVSVNGPIPSMDIDPDNDFDHFMAYMYSNTIGVFGSMMVMVLVMSGLPLNRRVFIWIMMFIMCGSIVAMGYSYILALRSVISVSAQSKFEDIFLIWRIIVLCILLMHAIRLALYISDTTSGFTRFLLLISCGSVVGALLVYIEKAWKKDVKLHHNKPIFKWWLH